MTVSFYLEVDDLYQLDAYLADYDEEEDNPVLYYSNNPASPTSILVTLDFYQFNELIDLELLQLI